MIKTRLVNLYEYYVLSVVVVDASLNFYVVFYLLTVLLLTALSHTTFIIIYYRYKSWF